MHPHITPHHINPIPWLTRTGLLGLTGSNDLRTVIEGAAQGAARSQLGLDMFTYRVRKYIGAYTAALDGKVRRVGRGIKQAGQHEGS